MCLPCFPWTWTEYEDPLDAMPEQHVWVHDGQAWSLQRYVSILFSSISCSISCVCFDSVGESMSCDDRCGGLPPYFFPFSGNLQLFFLGARNSKPVNSSSKVHSFSRLVRCNGHTGSCLQMDQVNGRAPPASTISFRSGFFTLRPLCSKHSLFFFSSFFLLLSSFAIFLSPREHSISSPAILGISKMPEAVLDAKSPKTPRRPKVGSEPFRQVHFQSPGTTNGGGPKAATCTSASASASTPTSTSSPFSSTTIPGGQGTAAAAPESTSKDNQPESFPQLGAPPNSAFGAGQWHTAVDPTQSVKLPGQPFAAGFPPGLTSASPQAHLFAPHPQLVNAPTCPPFPAAAQLPTPITYIGIPSSQHHHHHQHPQPLSFTTMADYQNAAPMPAGVNFQPPVPDTTFGPMPHVYVPRFDGSYVPAAVQVGLSPVQFVSAPAAYSTTVVMPKTYYYNGYTYYASRPAASPSRLIFLFRTVVSFVRCLGWLLVYDAPPFQLPRDHTFISFSFFNSRNVSRPAC